MLKVLTILDQLNAEWMARYLKPMGDIVSEVTAMIWWLMSTLPTRKRLIVRALAILSPSGVVLWLLE